ncbi:RNA polymerase sigma factor AlgU [Hahella chejuensis KCTC 2396]|uniref:RNA polymerase sigma factor AlgU n=2 Tax=Hahella chejuensis TaxID=158327 RepID=Q2SL40_HAHCH|nr:RNA polymerase sigma factor AlgU [Hahella chejuensis KCTC 2396]
MSVQVLTALESTRGRAELLDNKENMSAPNKTTDQQLVERVQRGDKRAFDMLVVKYQSKVMAIIARYIRDHHEVMDVAQEAFIKAYKALANFRGESAFYTWLYRIAINAAKNHLMAQGRRPPGEDVDADDAVLYEGGSALKDIDSPERQVHRDQVKQAIFQALDELPEDLRSALTLREFDGLSYEEIAEIMQCPVGTVRSRIFRARDAVDARIAPMLEQKMRA